MPAMIATVCRLTPGRLRIRMPSTISAIATSIWSARFSSREKGRPVMGTTDAGRMPALLAASAGGGDARRA